VEGRQHDSEERGSYSEPQLRVGRGRCRREGRSGNEIIWVLGTLMYDSSPPGICWLSSAA
jgi:hypothetical protein